jgi:DNA repair exonuclease SbcCD ATPase subunit
MKPKTLLLLSLLCLPLAASPLQASPEEINKLRETLRATLLQVRDLQNKVATLEAQDADKALTIEDLEAKLEVARKTLAEDKTMADRAIALLQEQNEQYEAEIGRQRVALDRWQSSHGEAVKKAQRLEIERSKLAREKNRLERIVADQRRKNHEMYTLALEVLERYKRHGLGDAILAREPFVGATRARFQEMVQEWGNGLSDQRIKPGDAASSSAAADAAASAAQAGENPEPTPASDTTTDVAPTAAR